MKILSVKEVAGVLMVAEPLPETALSTALSPDGCIVYEEGDEIPVTNTQVSSEE